MRWIGSGHRAVLLRDVLFHPLRSHIEVELVASPVMGRPAGWRRRAVVDLPYLMVVCPPAAFEEGAHEPFFLAGAGVSSVGDRFGGTVSEVSRLVGISFGEFITDVVGLAFFW
ncbi:MAG: hypothetical protein RI897_158 [Verrucomicrobiota bacterium]